ncbi:hypothetical protein Pcinc_013877 [Petrolisthes cinctipes]|uniref:Uncharacterized protein n=1 Tax=Petrolisthes cinctipes TaxID=88211 RepID=A0AAE1KRX3_PETCI|nr:hypothetical protein Pcinc_013877 [Petrolisthes cinctipes]
MRGYEEERKWNQITYHYVPPTSVADIIGQPVQQLVIWCKHTWRVAGDECLYIKICRRHAPSPIITDSVHSLAEQNSAYQPTSRTQPHPHPNPRAVVSLISSCILITNPPPYKILSFNINTCF